MQRDLDAAQQSEKEKEELLGQLTQQAEVLKQLAREDGLTGIANRRWLDFQLAQELERAQRFGHPLTVVLLDIDHFKSVNDRFSHQTGDAVLRTAARLLRDSCRSVDVLGRYGGEEFMLVLVETPCESALLFCEKLRHTIEEFDWRSVHPELHELTVSIGLCSSLVLATPEELIAQADQQLYRAKTQGRNQVCAG